VYKISFEECIEPCKMILGEVKVDEVNNRIHRKIVRDVRVPAKSIQVILDGSFMSMRNGRLFNDSQIVLAFPISLLHVKMYRLPMNSVASVRDTWLLQRCVEHVDE